jgi:ubiquinone/menaquinone biosynthesis C-methylase UbiE
MTDPWEHVFSLIKNNDRVLDVGIDIDAISARKLANCNANVVSIDESRTTLLQVLKKWKRQKLIAVCCDVSQLPFRENDFDFGLLSYFLHEADPRLHLNIINAMSRICRTIIIIEPSKFQNRNIYRELENTWASALKEKGIFEIYQDRSYWGEILRKSNLNVETSLVYRNDGFIPPCKLKSFSKNEEKLAISFEISPSHTERICNLARKISKIGIPRRDQLLLIASRRSN